MRPRVRTMRRESYSGAGSLFIVVAALSCLGLSGCGGPVVGPSEDSGLPIPLHGEEATIVGPSPTTTVPPIRHLPVATVRAARDGRGCILGVAEVEFETPGTKHACAERGSRIGLSFPEGRYCGYELYTSGVLVQAPVTGSETLALTVATSGSQSGQAGFVPRCQPSIGVQHFYVVQLRVD